MPTIAQVGKRGDADKEEGLEKKNDSFLPSLSIVINTFYAHACLQNISFHGKNNKEGITNSGLGILTSNMKLSWFF